MDKPEDRYIVKTSIGNWHVPENEVMFFATIHTLLEFDWIQRMDFLVAEINMIEYSYAQID